MNQRVKHHILFWLLFTVYYYAQSLSPDCVKELDPADIYLYALLSAVCFVPVAAVAVYASLEFILPRFVLHWSPLRLLASSLLLFIVIILLDFGMSFLFFNLATRSELVTIPLYRIFSLGFINSINAMLAALLVSGIRITRILYRQREEQHALLKQQKQLEMQLAKAEIHPGFILNALKAVQELVSRNAENAASVILQLAELLDYTLYEGSREKVDLEAELQALDNIIAIERAKNGRRNAVQFQLTGVPAGKQIPPLFLLQPLCQYFSDNPVYTRNHPVFVNVQIDNEQVRMTMETGKHKTTSAELYAFA